jgi:proline iminopeptidase
MIRIRPFVPLLVLGAVALVVRPRLMRWGATDEEAAAPYPGDDLLPDAESHSTMATTLPAPPEAVWPWLVQMGCNRAGWYSWDRLDNGGQPSADQIVPYWQELAEGDRLDSVPSGVTWFKVAKVDPPRTLVLRADLEVPSGRVFDPRGPRPSAYTEGIWGFHLSPLPDGQTRLVVRTHGRGRPWLASKISDLVLGNPAHVVMQTRQFHNLRRRVAMTVDVEKAAAEAEVTT